MTRTHLGLGGGKEQGPGLEDWGLTFLTWLLHLDRSVPPAASRAGGAAGPDLAKAICCFPCPAFLEIIVKHIKEKHVLEIIHKTIFVLL